MRTTMVYFLPFSLSLCLFLAIACPMPRFPSMPTYRLRAVQAYGMHITWFLKIVKCAIITHTHTQNTKTKQIVIGLTICFHMLIMTAQRNNKKKKNKTQFIVRYGFLTFRRKTNHYYNAITGFICSA